jgi:hypothetical protein
LINQVDSCKDFNGHYPNFYSNKLTNYTAQLIKNIDGKNNFSACGDVQARGM